MRRRITKAKVRRVIVKGCAGKIEYSSTSIYVRGQGSPIFKEVKLKGYNAIGTELFDCYNNVHSSGMKKAYESCRQIENW